VAALVFDAGGLIALDRGSREIGAILALAGEAGVEAVTSSACVAQAWRNPARQARLARALSGFIEHSLGPSTSRDCGLLLAGARTSDIADAALALVVQDGDTVLTSDATDIEHLLETAGKRAHIRRV
jgi:hypothetical protein